MIIQVLFFDRFYASLRLCVREKKTCMRWTFLYRLKLLLLFFFLISSSVDLGLLPLFFFPVFFSFPLIVQSLELCSFKEKLRLWGWVYCVENTLSGGKKMEVLLPFTMIVICLCNFMMSLCMYCLWSIYTLQQCNVCFKISKRKKNCNCTRYLQFLIGPFLYIWI